MSLPRWLCRHHLIRGSPLRITRRSVLSADAASKMRNATLNATAESPTNSESLVLFQFISLGLIIAVGSAGNTLVFYAFSKYLRIRRSPYVLMLGFVTLDLLRVGLSFPILFITAVHPLQSDYASEMCQLIAFMNVFCLLGNNLSDLGMAIDRYIDNQHKALYRRRCRGSTGLVMLAIVWGLASVFAFPTVYNARTVQNSLEPKCTFPHHYYINNGDVSGFLITIVVAFSLTNLIYMRLFCVLRGRRRMCPVVYEPAVSENWGFFNPRTDTPVRNRWVAHSLSETPIAVVSRTVFQSRFIPTNYDMALWRSKKQKENEKLTKLCFAIHVIFSTMWVPYVVVCFYLAYDSSKPRQNVPQWLEISATWLSYIQVTVTPVAFCSLSGFARNKGRTLNGKRRFSPTFSSNSSM